MSKGEEVLANGCRRFQKTVIVNGIATKVTIEKEPPEREAQMSRRIESDKARRAGFAGIRRVR